MQLLRENSNAIVHNSNCQESSSVTGFLTSKEVNLVSRVLSAPRLHLVNFAKLKKFLFFYIGIHCVTFVAPILEVCVFCGQLLHSLFPTSS